MAKFVKTFAIYYGGGATITPAIATALAKHDLLDIDRFRYNEVAPSTWAAVKALNPGIRIFNYMGGAEASNKRDADSIVYLNEIGRYAVSRGLVQGALNTSWPTLFLKDNTGSRVYNQDYSTPGASLFSYLMDFGHADYISYWLAAVNADISTQAWSADGIFADLCMLESTGSRYVSAASPSTPLLPLTYPTEAAWSTAMQTFIRGLRAGLTAAGKKLWCNAGATRSLAGYNAWIALGAGANPPDFMMEEGAFCVAWGSQVQFFQESEWTRQVDVLKNLANVSATMTSHTQLPVDGLGTDNYGNVVTFWQAFYYAYCSFCLGKNDTLQNAYFHFSSGPDYSHSVYYDEYDKIDLGVALGNYTVNAESGVNVYRREFANGYVYVNPTNNNVGSVPLPQPCRNITHTAILSDFSALPVVSAIAVPRWTGLVLLKSTYTPPAPGGGTGATSYVQSKIVNGLSTTYASTFDVTLDAPVTPGNLLAVGIRWLGGSPVLANFTSIADNLGNTYLPVDSSEAGGVCFKDFYARNIAGGSCTITVNLSSAHAYESIAVHEVAGAHLVDPLDRHGFIYNNDPGNAANALTSGSVTPVEDAQYIFGLTFANFNAVNSIAAGSGFTLRAVAASDATHAGVATENKIQTTAAAVAATFTQSAFDGWLTAIMTFRAQPLPGVPAPVVVPPAAPPIAPEVGAPSAGYGYETFSLFELDQPFCDHTYGTAPCAAVMGTTGSHKCHNTQATCQDPANYAPGTQTLRFSWPQEDMLRYGPLIPSIVSIETTPASINLAGMDKNVSALGSREVVTVKLRDSLHSDHQVDKYRLERASGAAQSDAVGYDPYNRGTFWGKFLARNPYYSAYRCRLYEAILDDGAAVFRLRNYVLNRIEGPADGEVTLVAKDLFSLIEQKKAVAPRASRGELSAALTAVAVSATLAPAGIGAIDYPASGHLACGGEVMAFTRVSDVVTLTRGALGTVAAAHDAQDSVQLVLSYVTQPAADIAYDLLLNYTSLTAADLPKAEWDVAAAGMSALYTARIATPVPVNELLGELSEQCGFSLWPDVVTGKIKFAALRPNAATVSIDDDGWIVEDSLSIRRQDDRRASEVWVYYGQRDPTKNLDEKSNFHSRIVIDDAAAAGDQQYGVPAIREIFSRWIPQFGRNFAKDTGERVLAMFRDPPIEAAFRLPARRYDDVALSRHFALTTADVQDDTGAMLPVTMAAVEIEYGENELTLRAQQVRFATPTTGTGERVIYIENDAFNLNLRTVHDSLYVALAGTETVRFVVVDGFTVGSTSTSQPAMQTGAWPAGVSLKLDIHGRVQGKGGRGGAGGTFGTAGSVGLIGGDALKATRAISVDNADGELWAGGGGGGGGGAFSASGNPGLPFGGGGGGGGGAGTDPGSGGSGGIGFLNFDGSVGLNGTKNTGGQGAAGAPGAGAGGRGGGPGLIGNTGGGATTAGGAGGTFGKYIDGNAFVTWVATGDRRGGVA